MSQSLGLINLNIYFFSCQNWQGFIYLYLYIGLLINNLRGLDYFFFFKLKFFFILKFILEFLLCQNLSNFDILLTLIFYLSLIVRHRMFT